MVPDERDAAQELHASVSDLGAFSRRAVRSDITGRIEGVRHIAAETEGDGACALHSTFGVPAGPSARLYFPGVRAMLLAHVPESVQEVYALHGGSLSEALADLVDPMWVELALPAARAIEQGVALSSLSAESRQALGRRGEGGRTERTQ